MQRSAARELPSFSSFSRPAPGLSPDRSFVQSDAAEKASRAKLRETVATECVKANKDADDPVSKCKKEREEWQDAAATQATADGLRTAMAALGLTLIGLGIGDGFAKYVFTKV